MAEQGQKALPIVLEEVQGPGPGLGLTWPLEKAEEAAKEEMETIHQKGRSQLMEKEMGTRDTQDSVNADAAAQLTSMMECASPRQTGLGGQGPAVLSEG